MFDCFRIVVYYGIFLSGFVKWCVVFFVFDILLFLGDVFNDDKVWLQWNEEVKVFYDLSILFYEFNVVIYESGMSELRYVEFWLFGMGIWLIIELSQG